VDTAQLFIRNSPAANLGIIRSRFRLLPSWRPRLSSPENEVVLAEHSWSLAGPWRRAIVDGPDDRPSGAWSRDPGLGRNLWVERRILGTQPRLAQLE